MIFLYMFDVIFFLLIYSSLFACFDESEVVCCRYNY